MDWQCSVSNGFVMQFEFHSEKNSKISRGDLSHCSTAAFFYQLKENDGEEIDNIARHLSNLDETNDTVDLTYTFSLASLIGDINTERFYTYRGERFGFDFCVV
jgi:hypothetical protein